MYGSFICLAGRLGDEPTKVLILFNSPVYQEINICRWLAANCLPIPFGTH
jgi:hypothetical protein